MSGLWITEFVLIQCRGPGWRAEENLYGNILWCRTRYGLREVCGEVGVEWTDTRRVSPNKQQVVSFYGGVAHARQLTVY